MKNFLEIITLENKVLIAIKNIISIEKIANEKNYEISIKSDDNYLWVEHFDSEDEANKRWATIREIISAK